MRCYTKTKGGLCYEKAIYNFNHYNISYIFFIFAYNQNLKTEEYIFNQLHDHYAVLTHIASDIRKYSNPDYFNKDELYIGSLLETAINFKQTLNSYVNAYNKSQKKQK